MRSLEGAASVLGLWALVAAGTGWGAQPTDIGKSEFDASCAVCHGIDGRGGPFAKYLSVGVPDLTRLTRDNGGVFPAARVYDIIDGREDVRAHGTRDMPIWGHRFASQAAPAYDDYPFNSRAAARARVLTVMEYVHRLQAK